MSLLLLTAVGSQFVFADEHTVGTDLEGLLRELLPAISAAEITRLIDSGHVVSPSTVDRTGAVSTRLAPGFQEAIRDDIAELVPTIGVEVLYLVDAPAPPIRIDADLLTILQAISTMEGIEYYSQTRDRMRTLFIESYVINGPDDRTRRPDPVVTSLPEQVRIYAFQRDSSFGRNVLELTYTTTRDAIRLRMRNLTRMFYQGFIPAVGPEELGLNLVVYPIGDQLLFYGMSAARTSGMAGTEGRIRESFTNRIHALYAWFERSIALEP